MADWEIDTSFEDLYQILSLKRPKNSRGEWELIKRFLIPAGCNRDDFGNWYIRIGEAPVLWSSHTDTVHWVQDPQNDVTQKLAITEDGILSANNSTCLGADCGAGIWIMLRMIKAGVEGLYVFHREEETGGKGSSWIAEHNPEFLKDIKYAIAFDRKGQKSIITFQAGGRCCSDAFANSLARELKLGHEPDKYGIFTDTAHYTKLIPECTNVSVGFEDEHTFREYLDIHYLKSLLDSILELDINNLVLERKVTDPDDLKTQYDAYLQEMLDRDWDDDNGFDPKDISLIRNNPKIVAEIMKEWGVLDDLLREIEFR